jgi:chromosome partitioning protein
MRSVVFLSQKGGSGKTTLAVHIAVAAEESGEKVALLDTDMQASAGAWGDVRAEATPPIARASPSETPRVIEAAQNDGITLLVIDTAPHAAPGAAIVVSSADFILIPCRPTAFDLSAVAASVDIVKAVGKLAAFVLNACPARAPEVIEAQEALAMYDLPIAPVTIGDRRAFSRAVASGNAVTEFETHGKAAQEIRKLWQWMRQYIYE